MLTEWTTTSWTAAGLVVLSAVGIYLAVILLTRLAGLRSFSKMSSFDFAMTVAIGSLIASTILTKDPPLLQAVVALASIYGLQFIAARLRNAGIGFDRVVDNRPMLLMVGAEMLRDNMRRERITENDLWAKLREANVLDLSQVRAVVLETTGDISVLHADADGPALSPDLLTGVRGGQHSL